MRPLTVTFLLAFAAAAAPTDHDAIAAAARDLPPEFAANALIRLAAVPDLEKSKAIEYLEQTFERAAGAQQPYRRYAAPLRLDGPVGYYNRAYRQEIDALSLRARAVEALLPLDLRKARDLFLRIPAIKIPRITCDDYLIYDVARFYEVLSQLAPKDSDPAALLQRYAGAIASPIEVAPMGQLLVNAKYIKDAEFRSLLSAYSAALGKISGDDRSFTSSHVAAKAIQDLAAECKRRNISALPLIESYRVYLVIHLAANRCADGDLMLGGQASFGLLPNRTAEPQTGNVITFFNEKLRQPPLQPIGEMEATPARLEGAALGLRSCQESECIAVSEKLRALLLASNGIPLMPADREKPEWQAKARAFLPVLAEWKETAAANPGEYFRERSAAYFALLNLTPDDPTREAILVAFVKFLEKNPFAATNRMEWFLSVNGLAGRLAIDPAFGKFSRLLTGSSDPVIALYARLEAVAPRTPDRVLSLL